MKKVTYKFRPNNNYYNQFAYKQHTELMELPKDEHGYILESELSKTIQQKILATYPKGILVWHKINR